MIFLTYASGASLSIWDQRAYAREKAVCTKSSASAQSLVSR